MDNRLNNLDHLFHPRSIAFIGATEEMGKWGFLIFNTILKGGWEGKLYPVNPGRDSILGIKAYPSIKDIPDEIDLVIFTIPARHMMTVVEECVAKGVKAGLIISAGFKEMGGDQVSIEAELAAKARAGNMLLVGPNCQGIFCSKEKLYAHMPVTFFPRTGPVAAVSQSGNLLNMFVGSALEAGVGVVKGVSSGNEADLKTEDYFEYFAEDPEVDAIVSYIENIPDGRSFFERTRRVTARKPVIVLKGGRTSSGKSAAKSHTGAMAVSDDLFNAACSQSGIILAQNINEAGVLAASFVNRPLPRGKRVAMITGGGGLGVIAADTCSEEGLDVVELSEETIEKLRGFLPDWWVPGNPVDLVAGLQFGSIIPMIEILMKSGEIDLIILMVVFAPSYGNKELKKDTGGVDLQNFAKIIAEEFQALKDRIYSLSCEHDVPIYPIMKLMEPSDELISDNPFAVYDHIEPACRAVKAMTRYYEYRKKLDQ